MSGPGTNLQEVLKFLHSKPCETCDAHAKEMNERGVEWCDSNFETILGWMRESAKEKKFFYFEPGARIILRSAIQKARKAALQS